ncbi:MAG: HD domain-containing protein [Campylobacterales bacterium]|nr:HD domain-containing protein [Campylobacterales bacterium]
MLFRYLLVILFLLLNYMVFYITNQNTRSKEEYSKYNHIEKLQINYEIFIKTQEDKADVIYETTINTDGVKEMLSEAWHTKDNQIRDYLRVKLHNLLKDRYEKFKQQGLLQYHFVFPDNKVFLRVHKPDKYGDDLSGVRLDFEKVNKTYEIVRGFSQGRTSHAFRNVYPIFDHENRHIGAIEISYPSELLQKNLNVVSRIHSHFLVNKHIFDSKMWSRDDRILEYKPSMENENYLLTYSKTHEENDDKNHINSVIKSLKNSIEKSIDKGERFSLVSDIYPDDIKVISFYPIKQNVTGNLSAWIVSYEDAPFIASSVKDNFYIRGVAFVIFVVLFYFVYKIYTQKNKLSSLLRSYDDNVIFSTTDRDGNITHVSKAFCDISGYSSDELIGKSHNIVRHIDMPKEVFSQLWDALKNKQIWKGEIKNLKKDGGFYWVDAEIEPLYDDKKNHIGYSAIRHDITDKKEVESIQKEIIFTMGSIGESRSKETGNHVKRVAEYSYILALKYGFSQKDAEMLRQASPMHDIGKVGIPDAVLHKPSALTEDEMEMIRQHSRIGYDLLKNSDRPLLKAAATIALEHHEKWDGTGYPQGLSGEDIHIYGRITAIADVFDALSSDRCYKKAWEDDRIFKLFKEESGKHFDPKLVKIFFENINELKNIRDSFRD